jgi:hypothetical protein
MLDNKFRSLEDIIERQMDNKLLGFTQLHTMKARLQEIEKATKNKNNPQRKNRWMKIAIFGTKLKS